MNDISRIVAPASLAHRMLGDKLNPLLQSYLAKGGTHPDSVYNRIQAGSAYVMLITTWPDVDVLTIRFGATPNQVRVTVRKKDADGTLGAETTVDLDLPHAIEWPEHTDGDYRRGADYDCLSTTPLRRICTDFMSIQAFSTVAVGARSNDGPYTRQNALVAAGVMDTDTRPATTHFATLEICYDVPWSGTLTVYSGQSQNSAARNFEWLTTSATDPDELTTPS